MPNHSKYPSKIESICMLRLSAIGDVTHVVPLTRQLQRSYPTAHITWIIGKVEHQLIGDIPGIEFIVFDKKRGWWAFYEIFQELNRRRFDLLLHLQISLRASLLSLLISADIRLGFDLARAKNLQWLFTNAKIAPAGRQHVLESFMGFAEWLGLDTSQLAWDIPVPAEAEAFAKQYIGDGQRTLLINPCSSVRKNNWRNWLPERYAAVADYAITRHGMKVIFTGGPSEQEQHFSKHICELMENEAQNLSGKTNLKQLLALIKYSTVVLAPDTGPMHMATTVNTPVIGLFASSNPKRTGPYLSQQWVVDAYPAAMEAFVGMAAEQAPWGKRVRSRDVMSLVSEEAVIEKLEAILTS